MADGGLIEPIPFETPLREGATHVLVLRSRPAGYRNRGLREFGEALVARGSPQFAALLGERRGVYNRQASELERGAEAVQQVAVPDGTRTIGRLQSDEEGVVHALRLGAKAMASAVLTAPIDLCWQPAVYRTSLPPVWLPEPGHEALGRQPAAATSSY